MSSAGPAALNLPPSPGDMLLGDWNPFSSAGELVGKVVADGWTGVALTIWGSGLWVMRFVLKIMDAFMTPDLSGNGPAREIYQYTFWAAGGLVLIMVFVQLATALWRRDGKSLAQMLMGLVQFIGVWAGWVGWAAMIVAACGGLTKALMEALLNVDAWSHWEPTGDFNLTQNGIEATLATVLAGLGIFMWAAAIGHFFVLLGRAGALLVIASVTPITAAGLVADVGKSWFWKSLRWFHAAALTPVLIVLVMGIGIKLTTGVAQGAADSPEAAVGTALPSTMMILISVAAPLALFRLLAFVDPGTSSGASMRAGLAAAGGIQGSLGGGASGGADSTASSTTSDGTSQGEAQSNQATAGRFGAAMAAVGGPVGGAVGAGLNAIMSVGTQAAALGADEMNQSGVGDSSYFPDYQRGGQRFNPDQRDNAGDNGPGAGGGDDPNQGPDRDNQNGSGPPTPSVPMPTLPGGPGGSSPIPGGRAGGKGDAGSSGGAAAAASEVPPVV